MTKLFVVFILLAAAATSAFKRNLPKSSISIKILRFNENRSLFALFAKRRTTLSRGRGSQDVPEVAKVTPVDTPVAEKEDIVAPELSNAISSDTASSSAAKGRQLSQKIQDDISDFERIGFLSEKKVVVEEGGVTKTLKNIFAGVFIADFFLVIAFLIWFLAAAAMQKTNPFLLERFQVTSSRVMYLITMNVLFITSIDILFSPRIFSNL